MPHLREIRTQPAVPCASVCADQATLCCGRGVYPMMSCPCARARTRACARRTRAQHARTRTHARKHTRRRRRSLPGGGVERVRPGQRRIGACAQTCAPMSCSTIMKPVAFPLAEGAQPRAKASAMATCDGGVIVSEPPHTCQTRAHARAHTHAHVHTKTRARTCAHAHAYTPTHAHTRPHKGTHALSCTHAQMGTCARIATNPSAMDGRRTPHRHAAHVCGCACVRVSAASLGSCRIRRSPCP